MNAPTETELTECGRCRGHGHIRRSYRRIECDECGGKGLLRRPVSAHDFNLRGEREATLDSLDRAAQERRAALRLQAGRLRRSGVPRWKWPEDVREYERGKDRKKTRKNRRCISIRRDVYEAFQEKIGGSVAAEVERLISRELGE